MILQGDSLEILKTLEDNSVDTVVTDPPYGYSFMSRDWDRAVPSVDIWRQCLRVLKPGAFMCVMSAPRSDVQNAMISRLMEAGFRLDFTPIYWTYASGFPKAGNIGKLVDKRNGRTPDWYADFAKHYGMQRKAKELTHNQVCEAAKAYANHNHGGASTNWEKGYNVPTLAQWQVLQPLLDLSLDYLPMIEREEAEREIIGKSKNKSGIGNAVKGHYTVGGTVAMHTDITAPATDQAIALDGSYAGFQPKPAVEVIIVAMKPLSEKTYVDQALANGHGVSWLDNARVGTGTGETKTVKYPDIRGDNYSQGKGAYSEKATVEYTVEDRGRFPANLSVSDNVLGDYSKFFDADAWAATLPFLITPKASKSEKNKGLNGLNCAKIEVCKDDNTEQVVSTLKAILESIPSLSIVESGLTLTVQSPTATLSTTLTAISKITDLKTYSLLMQSPTRESMKAALSKMMLGTSPANTVTSTSGLTTTTGTSTSEDGLLVADARNALYALLLKLSEKESWQPKTNVHPTVKSLRLMSYLITLFSRPGDVVLDPFCGSGSTNVAAHNLGRETIGIEREAEYVEIAKARLAHVKPEIAQLPPEEPTQAEPPVTIPDLIDGKQQLSLL